MSRRASDERDDARDAGRSRYYDDMPPSKPSRRHRRFDSSPPRPITITNKYQREVPHEREVVLNHTSPIHYVEAVRPPPVSNQPRLVMKGEEGNYVHVIPRPRSPEFLATHNGRGTDGGLVTRSREYDIDPGPEKPLVERERVREWRDGPSYGDYSDEEGYARAGRRPHSQRHTHAAEPAFRQTNVKTTSETAPNGDVIRTVEERIVETIVAGSVQALCKPASPVNTTVHLELPISEDLDDELEELARLRRLGDFKAAQVFFHQHLDVHMNNPYVLVQYAELLLDMGRFGAVLELDPAAAFRDYDGSLSPQPPSKLAGPARRRRRPSSPDSYKQPAWEDHRHAEERHRRVRWRDEPPEVNNTDDIRIVQRTRDDSWQGERRLRDVERERRRSRSRSRSRRRSRSPLPRGVTYVKQQEQVEYDDLLLLAWNWRLLRALARMHINATVEGSYYDVTSAMQTLEFLPDMGSTELQIVLLALRIRTMIDAWTQESIQDDGHLDRWGIDWSGLYKVLLTQGRVWDLRDFLVAGLGKFGLRGLDVKIADPEDDTDLVTIFKALVSRDARDERDEVTNLAYLDQLVSGMLELDLNDDVLGQTQWQRRAAREIADDVMGQYPHAMRSRAFVRWLLVEAAAAGCEEGSIIPDSLEELRGHLEESPGMLLPTTGWITLLIYVPKGTEVPRWHVPDVPAEAMAPVHLALKMAKDMRDYPTQVLCYKLLAVHSHDPAPLLQELSRIQKTEQEDYVGYIQTCLTRYICCTSTAAQKQLLADLTELDDVKGPKDGPAFLQDIQVLWAKDFVQRALGRRLGVSFFSKSTGYYSQLPSKARAFIRGSAFSSAFYDAIDFGRPAEDEIDIHIRPRRRGMDRERTVDVARPVLAQTVAQNGQTEIVHSGRRGFGVIDPPHPVKSDPRTQITIDNTPYVQDEDITIRVADRKPVNYGDSPADRKHSGRHRDRDVVRYTKENEYFEPSKTERYTKEMEYYEPSKTEEYDRIRSRPVSPPTFESGGYERTRNRSVSPPTFDDAGYRGPPPALPIARRAFETRQSPRIVVTRSGDSGRTPVRVVETRYDRPDDGASKRTLSVGAEHTSRQTPATTVREKVSGLFPTTADWAIVPAAGVPDPERALVPWRGGYHHEWVAKNALDNRNQAENDVNSDDEWTSDDSGPDSFEEERPREARVVRRERERGTDNMGSSTTRPASRTAGRNRDERERHVHSEYMDSTGIWDNWDSIKSKKKENDWAQEIQQQNDHISRKPARPIPLAGGPQPHVADDPNDERQGVWRPRIQQYEHGDASEGDYADGWGFARRKQKQSANPEDEGIRVVGAAPSHSARTSEEDAEAARRRQDIQRWQDEGLLGKTDMGISEGPRKRRRKKEGKKARSRRHDEAMERHEDAPAQQADREERFTPFRQPTIDEIPDAGEEPGVVEVD